MKQTGHKSVQMVRRYIRDGRLFRENSAGRSNLSGLWNNRQQIEAFSVIFPYTEQFLHHVYRYLFCPSHAASSVGQPDAGVIPELFR